MKRLLASIAEENYTLRSQWEIPRTFYVSYRDVARWRPRQARGGGLPTISFSRDQTADAMLRFAAAGDVVCGLNFANGSTPGGGYKHGASAQEEDCCRRMPTLYTSLLQAQKQGFYPFGPGTCQSPDDPAGYCDVLYTKGIIIARRGADNGYALMGPQEEARVSMVAAAAPNVKFARDITSPDMLRGAMRSIFVAPKLMQPEVTTLVLGAWGCGAFGGDPALYSELFIEALTKENFGQHYKEVHFAIPEGPDGNYEAFRQAFANVPHLSVVDI